MNKLVQITLKADQEKYNLDGDASITVVDANSYYIGRIITQHHGWNQISLQLGPAFLSTTTNRSY